MRDIAQGLFQLLNSIFDYHGDDFHRDKYGNPRKDGLEHCSYLLCDPQRLNAALGESAAIPNPTGCAGQQVATNLIVATSAVNQALSAIL